jgi:hypothetical protein
LLASQLYVVAHNHDRGSAIIRLAWPDMTLVAIDKTTTVMAHNVWVTDQGQTIVCDSMRGTLVDVATGEIVWTCDEVNAVTRGLAASGDYVFVGHSALGTREARVSRDSRIWVIERNTWKTLDCLLLPDAGNIHEIRILDQPDSCHHGQVFRGNIAAQPPIDLHQFELERSPSIIAWPLPAMPDKYDSPVVLDLWEQHAAFSQMDDHLAVAGDFSLATLKRFNATDVIVQACFDVRDASARHAGVIARYLGPGDHNMLVALVAKADDRYRAQLWCHHTGSWSCLRTANLSRGEGTLELKAIGQQVFVAIDGQSVIQTDVAGSPQRGGVGIRAARATLTAFRAENHDCRSGCIVEPKCA